MNKQKERNYFVVQVDCKLDEVMTFRNMLICGKQFQAPLLLKIAIAKNIVIMSTLFFIIIIISFH